MIRKIMSYVQQYKKESIIAPVAMIGEVGMEVAIPFVMSKMIDVGINGAGGTPYIIKILGRSQTRCIFISGYYLPYTAHI